MQKPVGLNSRLLATHTERMRFTVGALLACAALGEFGCRGRTGWLCHPSNQKLETPTACPSLPLCGISIVRILGITLILVHLGL